jgi:magnesium-transporting ATPase (P-type)
MIVTVVGDFSCAGKISAILRTQELSATPLQHKLEAIARDIGFFGLYSAVLILIVLIIRFIIEKSVNGFEWSNLTELLHYLILAITVVAVSIPEGLPLSVTISLAFSVKKMLKDMNLVK